MTSRRRVVMVASSYPRFPGDTVGTFMEPIARGLAARGDEIHMVLPWHPRWTRPLREDGITFHLFRYAPLAGLNVFGYAGSLEADERLRGAAIAATPLAAAAGWRAARSVARAVDATLVHGHWVVPGGVIAAAAAGSRPLVISLHGSDVFVAEKHAAIGRAARWAFGKAAYVTACSEDLRQRAIGLGADPARSRTIPYGVDAARFRPDADARARVRAKWGLAPNDEVVLGVGRFVRKKGFEYLIDAVARLAPARPGLRLVLAGAGDLRAEFQDRLAARGIADRAILPGVLLQDEVAAALAAADVSVVPSVKDPSGNVDGLPNVVLESLASGTPLVASPAGGIGAVVKDGSTAVLAAEGDVPAIAAAVGRLLDDPEFAAEIGRAGREWATREGTWDRAVDGFSAAYESACGGSNGCA